MTPDPLDDPRLTAMGLLIEAYQGLTARLDPVHAAHGLSGSDFDTLIRLARSTGRQLRMTDLAAQTSMSTSGITRIVEAALRSSPTPAPSGSPPMCLTSWLPSSAGSPVC